MNTFLVKKSDTLFHDSPLAGDVACLCSRCSRLIAKHVTVIRAWLPDGRGQYRYHPGCFGALIVPKGSRTEPLNFN